MPRAVLPRREFHHTAAHPLAMSMATVDAAVGWRSFELGDATGPGWWNCADALARPGCFGYWRARLSARLAEQYGEVPVRVPAGYVLQWYLGVPAHTGAMLFHHARRVPALEPGRLAFRLDSAYLQAIALRPATFWCLPSDPDADHPDSAVVGDDAELAAVLRQQVVDHAGHFLRAYGPTVPFGPRTLWAAVSDALDTGLLLAGRSAGDERAGVADARLVLAQRYEPLRSVSRTRTVVDTHGRAHWTLQRGSCCFYYALPGVTQPCATCPRLDDAERGRILGELYSR